MVSVILFPPLTAIFRTTALTGLQWLIVAGLSLFPLLAVEGEKLLLHPAKKKTGICRKTGRRTCTAGDGKEAPAN